MIMTQCFKKKILKLYLLPIDFLYIDLLIIKIGKNNFII